MGWFGAVILLLTSAVLLMIIWKKVAKEEVGVARHKETQDGVQGQVAFWLVERAPLRPPRPPTKPKKKGKPDPESPAGRAMAALLREEMVHHNLGLEAAHNRLKQRAPGPVSRAFLEGRMRRATVLHALQGYTGPLPLFWPWYVCIAMVRFGRRRLYLDTITAAVREMRT